MMKMMMHICDYSGSTRLWCRSVPYGPGEMVRLQDGEIVGLQDGERVRRENNSDHFDEKIPAHGSGCERGRCTWLG